MRTMSMATSSMEAAAEQTVVVKLVTGMVSEPGSGMASEQGTGMVWEPPAVVQVEVTALATAPRTGTVLKPAAAQVEPARQVEATVLASAPRGAETALEPELVSELAPQAVETPASRQAPSEVETASKLAPQVAETTASRPAASEAATGSEPATAWGTATEKRRAPPAPTRPAMSKRRRGAADPSWRSRASVVAVAQESLS
uniref:Uncharacterized protein n=1 Tax=Arundo donax TaxID=35708 RepID=A0A0A9GLM3_ARUDO